MPPDISTTADLLRDDADQIIALLNDMREILEEYPDLKDKADTTWILDIKNSLYGQQETYNLVDTITELRRIETDKENL